MITSRASASRPDIQLLTAFDNRHSVHADRLLLFLEGPLLRESCSLSCCSFFLFFLRQSSQVLDLGHALNLNPLRVLLRHIFHVKFLLVEDLAF